MAICDRVKVQRKIALRLLDAECGKLSDALAVLNSEYLRENDSSQHGVLGLAAFSIEG
ncbi:MAG TPA: hypothetical protein V6C85_27190 [Allocoleopsis sp.]